MKISHVKISLLAGLVLFVLASCKKETSLTGTTATSTTVSQAVVASVQAIAVGTTSSRIAGTDSLYVIGTCDAHHHLPCGHIFNHHPTIVSIIKFF